MPRFSLLLVSVWALFIAILSLIPGQDLPEIAIDHFDKIGHAVVYAILAIFIYRASVDHKLQTPILLALFIPMIYGVGIEYLQDILSQDRHADVYDVLANAFGAIVVSLITIMKR